MFHMRYGLRADTPIPGSPCGIHNRLERDTVRLQRFGRGVNCRVSIQQTYYRWRKEYGGLKTDQARRMKDLEKENARLRRAISDLTLDKLILQKAARGNF